MTKKKDKKLNQVLQPGGEGMQYLINTLKKYQMMQQKQQQWNKQRSKFYNLTSKVFDDDESSDNSFDNIYNKYNGVGVVNYSKITNNRKTHNNIEKNYIYDERITNNNDSIDNINNYERDNMKVIYKLI